MNKNDSPRSKDRLKFLPATSDSERYYAAIERALIRFLKHEIYVPLIEQLPIPRYNKILNAAESLIEAIRKGTVYHEKGAFRGAFTADISRELRAMGAKWDRVKRAYVMPIKQVPIDVRSEVYVSRARFDMSMERVKKFLDQMMPAKIAEGLRIEKLYEHTVGEIHDDVNTAISKLEVKVTLSDKEREQIAKQYTENMKLYITDFLEKEIPRLRKDVEDVVFAGFRTKALEKKIRDSYKTSEEKAKFLARQESRLLLSRYHQGVMEKSGVEKYMWRCVNNPKDPSPEDHAPGNVRYYHGLLDGKIFSWDDPPRVNAKGDRKHPMQDFNCRCIAVPVIES